MAGPWFVDPENGLTTNNGLSAETPWKLIPGQTGATAQTGYGVVAGDTINVKNGTTTDLRVVPPANNLTYRGYGLADNALAINLPMPFAPWKTYPARIVREGGVHEGMWTIDQRNINASAIGGTSATGVTIEDVCIIGPSSLGSHNAVQLGTTASTGSYSGFTLRRFRIAGSSNRGLSLYIMNVTIEHGLIEYTSDDNISLWGMTANSGRAGSVDTLRYLDLREPNLESPEDSTPGAGGDFVQTVPNNGDYSGTTRISYVRGVKSTSAKQGLVLHCMNASASMSADHCNFSGGGSVAVLVGHLKGSASFTNMVIDPGQGSELHLFRFDPADVSPPSYAMDTGSSLTIRNVVSHGASMPGFYCSAFSAGAYSFDGSISIENCTALGVNGSSLGYAGSISLWSTTSQSTYGTEFDFQARNNCFAATGKPDFIIPTGTGGDSRFRFVSNQGSGSGCRIGETSYADMAAFEAAHNQATGNINADPMVTAIGAPLLGSPLLSGGVDIGPRRDIRGFQSRKHIGAYGAARLRFV